jgi:hypothetical protein
MHLSHFIGWSIHSLRYDAQPIFDSLDYLALERILKLAL